MHKILCLTKSKADIILLSDTRLNSESNKSGVNNLNKKFFFNGCNFHHNSTGPNQGTAILTLSKLKLEIIKTEGDIMGNFILLKCKINNKLMCIGSICGLNINENILVYEQLQKGVLEMGCETFILGGDWNRTWDTNIDVLDMAAIPSKLRSEKLKKMCETLKITDPYQVLYPNKLEYTYIPAALHHTNRSRINFFCVLTVVINNIQN